MRVMLIRCTPVLVMGALVVGAAVATATFKASSPPWTAPIQTEAARPRQADEYDRAAAERERQLEAAARARESERGTFIAKLTGALRSVEAYGTWVVGRAALLRMASPVPASSPPIETQLRTLSVQTVEVATKATHEDRSRAAADLAAERERQLEAAARAREVERATRLARLSPALRRLHVPAALTLSIDGRAAERVEVREQLGERRFDYGAAKIESTPSGALLVEGVTDRALWLVPQQDGVWHGRFRAAGRYLTVTLEALP